MPHVEKTISSKSECTRGWRVAKALRFLADSNRLLGLREEGIL
jgi:hypothetical protein